MSTKKEKKVQDIQNKLEESRQARIKMLEESNKSKKKKSSDYLKDFEDFWARNRKSYSADRSLKGIIWAHLKAIKHDKPEKFEEGIKHFGLNKGDK